MRTELVALLGKYPIRNLYAYGSKVYGTASPTSDSDYIAVMDGSLGQELNLTAEGIDVTLYDVSRFQARLDDHEISVLECLWLPPEYILKQELAFQWKLDLSKLRESLSAKASNSFVKAKKKFDVERQPYIAKKSLWHSLRILRFGLQIAEYGCIADYEESVDLWTEIRDNPSVVWEDYKKQYQDTYNKLKTQFRLVAPKRGN